MSDLFYRGYRWSLLKHGSLAAFACYDRKLHFIARYAVDPHKPLHMVAARWWPCAHRARQSMFAITVPITAIDNVPWEIHEIEDEPAYQAALTSFRSCF